jgi:enamine deaminase RidA (YjgF/YER057c/UK114 family)
MNTVSTPSATTLPNPDGNSAELRLKRIGLKLPPPPDPFGIYAEAVQTGNLLFLTGMLPTKDRSASVVGRLGAALTVEDARKAARLAAINALAVARQHLGSLDRVSRIVRLGVSIATSGEVREHPQVADAASELLQDVFGKEKNPSRLVYGVASLPLGVPVELELIFEVVANEPLLYLSAKNQNEPRNPFSRDAVPASPRMGRDAGGRRRGTAARSNLQHRGGPAPQAVLPCHHCTQPLA